MQEEILNSNVDDVDVDASYEDIRFGGGKEVQKVVFEVTGNVDVFALYNIAVQHYTP